MKSSTSFENSTSAQRLFRENLRLKHRSSFKTGFCNWADLFSLIQSHKSEGRFSRVMTQKWGRGRFTMFTLVSFREKKKHKNYNIHVFPEFSMKITNSVTEGSNPMNPLELPLKCYLLKAKFMHTVFTIRLVWCGMSGKRIISQHVYERVS